MDGKASSSGGAALTMLLFGEKARAHSSPFFEPWSSIYFWLEDHRETCETGLRGLNRCFDYGGALDKPPPPRFFPEYKQQLILYQILSPAGAHSNGGLNAMNQVKQACKAQGLNHCFDGGGPLDKQPPPCIFLENKQELVLHQILSSGAHSKCNVTAMNEVKQTCKAQGLNSCFGGGGALDEQPPPCCIFENQRVTKNVYPDSIKVSVSNEVVYYVGYRPDVSNEVSVK